MPTSEPTTVIWNLNVLTLGALSRRISVLASSPDAALVKGREQLDDGETLTFCLPDHQIQAASSQCSGQDTRPFGGVLP